MNIKTDFFDEQRFAPDADQWPLVGYLMKPFGYSNFPKEIMPAPKEWVEKEANMVFYREHEKVSSFLSDENEEEIV